MKSTKESLSSTQDSEVENTKKFLLKPLDDIKQNSEEMSVKVTVEISDIQFVSIAPKLTASSDCFRPLFETPFMKRFLSIQNQLSLKFESSREKPSQTLFSQQSSQSRLEIKKPQPTSKYCQLCRYKFQQDYQDHIKHKAHINYLKASPFQKYIQSLVENFKTSLTYKRNCSLQNDLFANGKDLSNSRKKVKQDKFHSKIDRLNVDFAQKQPNSTESTNQSSANDPKDKAQMNNSQKE